MDETVQERVFEWQTEMRNKYHVPDEFEILMNYMHDGIENNIEGYIEYCATWDKLLLEKIADNTMWQLELVDGERKIYPRMTQEQYIHSLGSDIKNSADFSQKDSDLMAHFIQVISVLQRSEWYRNTTKGSVQYNMNHDGLNRANMAPLEQTVFTLIYIRQLIDKDNLTDKVCGRYKNFIGNLHKQKYIAMLQKEFNKYLNDTPSYVPVSKCVNNNREFIGAFMYGALIIHGAQNSEKNIKHRNRYKQMYLDKKNREFIIWELNWTLLQLLGMASRIGVFLQRDFANWTAQKIAPKPDVFWQETMFKWLPTVEEKTQAEQTTTQPVFNKAYDVEISNKVVGKE